MDLFMKQVDGNVAVGGGYAPMPLLHPDSALVLGGIPRFLLATFRFTDVTASFFACSQTRASQSGIKTPAPARQHLYTHTHHFPSTFTV